MCLKDDYKRCNEANSRFLTYSNSLKLCIGVPRQCPEDSRRYYTVTNGSKNFKKGFMRFLDVPRKFQVVRIGV